MHHFAMHVGQTKIAAGIAVGQLQVIEAQQVQHRGVQVVQVDFVFDGVVAVVGHAVAESAVCSVFWNLTICLYALLTDALQLGIVFSNTSL